VTKNRNDSDPELEAGTRVDLGDDLVEKTAILAPSEGGPAQDQELLITRSSSSAPARQEPIESRLQSARILIGEGILEEAKKILHKVLVEDAGSIEARHALEEIHELELKQIFGEETGRQVYARGKNTPEAIDADQILEQLDRDLSLGLGGRDLPGLLRNAENLRQLTSRLDSELADLSAQDNIDVGVGFLEMGLAEIAISRFNAALAAYTGSSATPPQAIISATSLLAVAQLAALKPFEAQFTLQPALNDSELSPEAKIDLYYLMGRVQEQLGKPDRAADWFRHVAEINPKYRDVRERLAKSR